MDHLRSNCKAMAAWAWCSCFPDAAVKGWSGGCARRDNTLRYFKGACPRLASELASIFLALWAGFLQESLITERREEEEAGKGKGKGEEGKEEGEESQIIDLGTLSPLFKNETLFTEANRHKILAYSLIN